jgi:hypothetical protein
MFYYDLNLLEIADKRRQLEEVALPIIATYAKQKDAETRSTTSTTPTTSPERQQSRAVTPILPERQLIVSDPPIEDYESELLDDHRNLPPRQLPGNNVKQLEELLIKQGKQIRALYQMQKTSNEKLTWLQNHFNKQNENKNNDLSPKVFGVSQFQFTKLYRYF